MTVSHIVPEDVGEEAVYVTSSTHIDNYVLAANVAQSVTKPTNGNYVMISADGAFWAAYDRTASTGSSTITDGTGSELIPAPYYIYRHVNSVTTISIAATAARKVSVMWFK